MGMTLLEYAKTQPANSIARAYIEMFSESDVVRALPFNTIPGGAYQYDQSAALPGVAFRGINESFTATTGVVNPQVEALRIAGGDIDVDRALVRWYGPDRRSREERLKVLALSQAIATKVIKGDSTSDPREFDGLQVRLTGNQLITNSASSGGAVLSLAKLDEAIDQVVDPTHLIMNKGMRRALTVASRTTSVGGNVTTEIDEFGKQITRYNGLPILVPYADNGGTDFLGFTEAASNPSGATSTSIYCVSFGDGMVSGIQNAPIDVRDLGETDSSPVLRTRLEWDVSIVVEHGRAAARLYSVNSGAVVA